MSCRSDILANLVEKPYEKRDLVDELDIARSTLDRAIRELEAYGLVTYSDGKYTVTTIGERLSVHFFSLLGRVELTIEFEPFLEYTSTDEFDLDVRELAGADLLTPESNDPYAMINRHVKVLGRADHFRGVLPIIGLHAFETAYERVLDHGAYHELIVDSGVAETLRSNEDYQNKFRELCEQNGCEILVYDGAIPYFVGVFDDEIVQIGVDEGGEPRALLETDRREVRTWAHETLEEYKQQATPVAQLLSQNRTGT